MVASSLLAPPMASSAYPSYPISPLSPDPACCSVFPLPKLAEPVSGKRASRGTQQRYSRKTSQIRIANDIADSLNMLVGVETPCVPPGLPCHELHASVHANLLSSVSLSPLPGDLPTAREAFLELRGARDSYELPTNMASYKRDMSCLAAFFLR